MASFFDGDPMSFQNVIERINNFAPDRFLRLKIVSPGGAVLTYGYIHPHIAEILNQHVTVNPRMHEAEIFYGSSPVNMTEKFRAMENALIAAGILKTRPGEDELMDVFDIQQPETAVAQMPRGLMPYLGCPMRYSYAFMHGDQSVFLANRHDEGKVDIFGGACQAGQDFHAAIIEEMMQEASVDLARHPIHQFAGYIVGSRHTTDGYGSRHQIVAAYTINLDYAKRAGFIAEDFAPHPLEDGPTDYIRERSLGDLGCIIRGIDVINPLKAGVILLGMHVTGLARDRDLTPVIKQLRAGANQSVFLGEECMRRLPSPHPVHAARATLG
jgi:8-oxo-dGTP pyrophosphatase MutT (NUDIX family)